MLRLVAQETIGMVAELGIPLARQPAAVVVPVTTVACFGLQSVALAWAEVAYSRSGGFSGLALVAKARDAAVRVVGGVFAAVASVWAAWILITCDAGLITDFDAVDSRAEVRSFTSRVDAVKLFCGL